MAQGILRLAIAAMGTRFEIVLAGKRERELRDAGGAAREVIEETDQRLSLFRRDSDLAHWNRAASRRDVALDEDAWDLLTTCRDVHRLSRGAFDPTVAPLMRQWGFHPGQPGGGKAPRDGSGQGPHGGGGVGPRDGSGRAPVPPVGMKHVALDSRRHTMRFEREGLVLDLGGIAKGHALELAARVLRECGVPRALLHGGTSTVVAIGAPPGLRGWRVAIRPPPGRIGEPGLAGCAVPPRSPGPPGPPRETPAPPLVVTLRDTALSVSGPHGRTTMRDGRRLGHVIDPRTRSPAASGVHLAWVIAKDARLADAWSTALVVLPRRPRGMPRAMASAILTTTWSLVQASRPHPPLEAA